LNSQASYDTARANRIVAQRQVDDAFEALVTLTNRQLQRDPGHFSHNLPILPPAPNDAKAWVETAARQNLNLLASNYAVSAAEQTLKQRKAGHAPTVDAVARYEKGDNDALGFSNPSAFGQPYKGDVEQTSIGLQLNIPIYSGGLINSQVRQSYAQLDQTEQQRESLRRSIVENTRDLHRAVNTDVEQVQARKQSIISNQSAVEATEIGYQVGTRNIVDVLDAQRQLYTSVRDYNNTRYDYILDNLRLKQQAGTLNPGDLQDLARWLKADYNPDKDFLPPDLAKAAAEQLKARPGQ
jgi:outer membrane protein